MSVVSPHLAWTATPSSAGSASNHPAIDTFRFDTSEGPVSRGAFFEGLRDADAARTTFDALLLGARYAAFFLEMPPLTRASLGAPVELTLLDAPQLAHLRPDPSSFEDEFSRVGNATVATFSNLGGDATLVVPCPLPASAGAPMSAYPHLASFVRGAPTTQRHALWAALGRAVLERVTDAPLWVSTAGLGVSWLHLRLDVRPKYYRHTPYKSP